MGSGDFKFIYNDLYSKDPTVKNRFDSYSPEFDYNAMSKTLDKVYSNQQTQLGKTAGVRVDDARRAAAARMKSSGITGGAMMEDAVNNAGNDISGSYFDTLGGLGIGRMSQDVGLMDRANANKFQTTQAATNVDMQNIMAMLQRYGLLDRVTGDMTNAQYQEDNAPGTFDDILAILNTGANVGKAFYKP